MRGSNSIAAVSIPAAARLGTRSGSANAPAMQTSSAPRGISARSSAAGVCTANTMPAPARAAAASVAISAPAAAKSASEMEADAPPRFRPRRSVQGRSDFLTVPVSPRPGFRGTPFLQHREAHPTNPSRIWEPGHGEGRGGGQPSCPVRCSRDQCTRCARVARGVIGKSLAETG